ncbi:MAG: hypothetical protein II849_09295 [Bacteroidales bacterium]|nr:hypothetical protein [Bacteroidales bacterium]
MRIIIIEGESAEIKETIKVFLDKIRKKGDSADKYRQKTVNKPADNPEGDTGKRTESSAGDKEQDDTCPWMRRQKAKNNPIRRKHSIYVYTLTDPDGNETRMMQKEAYKVLEMEGYPKTLFALQRRLQRGQRIEFNGYILTRKKL